jgi:hypothetical protein
VGRHVLPPFVRFRAFVAKFRCNAYLSVVDVVHDGLWRFPDDLRLTVHWCWKAWYEASASSQSWLPKWLRADARLHGDFNIYNAAKAARIFPRTLMYPITHSKPRRTLSPAFDKVRHMRIDRPERAGILSRRELKQIVADMVG